MKRWFVPHPYLFGVFPVLFLFSQNARDMRAGDMAAPLIAVIVLTLAATLALKFVLRNIKKAALVVSAFWVLFFSFGHILNLLRLLGLDFEQFDTAVNVVTLAVMGLFLIATVWLSARARGDLPRLTMVLNSVVVLLVAFQIVHGGYLVATRPSVDIAPTEVAAERTQEGPLPNIYYIILDGYARHDVLKTYYGFDNSGFLAFLRERGFYIADSSHANYAQTMQSLTSALNMNYISEIVHIEDLGAARTAMAEIFLGNAVFRFLRQRGYRIVSFSSGYDLTEIADAEITLAPRANLSEFETLIWLTTPLPYLFPGGGTPYDRHRDRILYTLDQLPVVTDMPPPWFVLAHIVAPHPPFVFGNRGADFEPDRPYNFYDGSYYFDLGGTLDEYITSYRHQAAYVTQRIQDALERILAGSGDDPPVIILQADHGPGSQLDWADRNKTWVKERFAILNAYYLPGADSVPLYPTITPVNTFRLVLNAYFDTDYTTLPDSSFYSPWVHPYWYQNVTVWLGDDLPIRDLPDSVKKVRWQMYQGRTE
ncbi:MAG: LTA synthase family protein [candidate division Zixibacteria bacterium]|nr:LTA synthase family protein [candidate division Zixibacteria bacterium]